MCVWGRSMLIVLLLALGLAPSSLAQESERVDLSGSWHFAPDPLADGETMGWHRSDLEIARWDEVQVPHTWSVDGRYLGYIGTAWYRKTLTVPQHLDGEHLRLEFEAVFYRARVWVNGTLVGQHEGGYTPFRVDVTPHIDPGQENVVAVEVDNRWSRTTIPGARFGDQPNDQVYPWWEYGGIIRGVSLLASAPVYVENQKVVATPDLESGSARIQSTVWVVNATGSAVQRRLGLEIEYAEGDQPVATWQEDERLQADVRIPAQDTLSVELAFDLPAEAVNLWHPDHPYRYAQRAHIGSADAAGTRQVENVPVATFGIRKVEMRNAQLLLNGEPVKMGGANRHSDYPGVGSVEPDSVIEQDMRLLKEGNMELMRLHHYPSPKNALDWADRNGMLLIAEAGSWGFGLEKLSNPEVRALFQAQTEEMMRRDWNHPSIIGWSVGNEYQSDAPEGVAWTRDMYEFVKTLDASRPVTFMALGGKLKAEGYADPSASSLHYVDFIAVNFYFSPEESGERLDAAHAEWPDKPILISEWGRRADQMPERERSQYVRDVLDMVRGRDYVIGASFWSYNDYRSRYPGTNRDGYRHWGLVNAQREPRGAYHTIREELAPVTLAGEAEIGADGTITSHIQVVGRTDFPRYTLRDYEMRAQLIDAQGRVMQEKRQQIDELRPGGTAEFEWSYRVDNVEEVDHIRAEVVRPMGFSTIDHTISIVEGE